MKLKGQVIKASKKQYVLKEQLGEGGFSTIYQTNYPQVICKVQVLMNTQMVNTYNREKQILKTISHPNIIKLYDSHEMEARGNKCGFLFMQKCANGTAFDILEKNEGGFVHERILIKILLIVVDVLEHLHNRGIAHRDIKMENILLNQKAEYKLCDFGSCSKTTIKTVDASNRVEVEEYIEKTTTPLYRSPEQLDLYSGFEIGVKVDIFALGVLAFMMCFQKPPFESRLSAINNQFFLPEDHNYSEELVNFITKCFATDPLDRPSAAEAKSELQQMAKIKRMQMNIDVAQEFTLTLKQLSHIHDGNMKKSSTVAETGFLNKMKRIYNQMTTETEGWIAGFVEDSEESPMLKYNRSIISKCYEKKYKIEKVYELIEKYSEEYKGKSLVALKLLILVHNFLRKGPKQAITYQKQNSPLQFCTRLYKLWKTGMKTVNEQDFKRNPFVCLLIRSYALILISKIKFCFENSHLIEANYSITPYLSNIKENTILKLGFIHSMIAFLSHCLDFHENVQRIDYLTEIQKAIVLSMIDEEYCLISSLTFIIAAFKTAVCYVKEDIDFVSLQSQVRSVQRSFEEVYRRLAKLLDWAQKHHIMVENSNITLNLDVVSYINNIKIEKKAGKFNVNDHLNYKNTIYGLKIPLTYEEVVRNPDFLKDVEHSETNSKIVVEVNQFKVKKSPIKQGEQEKNGGASKVEKKSSPQAEVSPKQRSPIQPKVNSNQKKEATNETAGTSFSKPKNQKDKIFQNFSFEDKKAEKQQGSSKINENQMEFTHQNLNKDFFSINAAVVEQKNDQFNDFFSIVENKFQKEKVTKRTNPQEEEPIIHSNVSKQVFLSETKPDINKIELINFFYDEDEPVQKETKKTTAESQPNLANLITFEANENETSIMNKTVIEKTAKVEQQVPDVFILDEPQYISTGQSNSTAAILEKPKVVEKRSQDSPSKKDRNLIDLKEFVIKEVKKNAEQYIIDFSTLIFKEKIGYGNSSQVFRGEWRGREVAIKKIKDNLSHSQKQFKRQIMTCVRIRHHPQLVTLIGVCEHEKYFYIVNEYCNGSTLFDLLHQSNQTIPWGTRINIAKHIARGMIFLHTNDPPIIHRDLKSLNLLLVNKYNEATPELTQLKIADFGLSRDYASTYMTGTLGTYHWMAPEIFNNEPYTLKADVYSYGIILWEIASRVPPYTNMKNPQALMKFVTIDNGRPDMSFVDKDCPYEWKMLMTRCWDKFSSNRPTFVEILACLQFIGK